MWFHVDKLSSAHVYLRMPSGMAWDAISEALLIDCAQLVKANSIEGTRVLFMRELRGGGVHSGRAQATRRITSQSYIPRLIT